MANDVLFDWDSEILEDGNSGVPFVCLPEGDYQYTVTKLDKSTYMPRSSSKIPAGTKMAIVEMTFKKDGKQSVVFERLYLIGSMEWKISSFFRSVGLKKHGEKLKMDWNAVTGLTGWAHLTVEDWTGTDGQTRQSNRLGYWISPEEAPQQEAPKWSAGQF